MARVFGELLNAPVDVTTPFFRLGASSLTVVLAHRRLRAELDDGLSVVDMFANATVRDLATFITGRREAATVTATPGAGPLDGTATGGDPAQAVHHPAAEAPSESRAAARRTARALAAEVAG